MFNLFSPKSKREALQDQYDQLMSKVYELESTNIKAAEEKRRKAQAILMRLVELDKAV